DPGGRAPGISITAAAACAVPARPNHRLAGTGGLWAHARHPDASAGGAGRGPAHLCALSRRHRTHRHRYRLLSDRAGAGRCRGAAAPESAVAAERALGELAGIATDRGTGRVHPGLAASSAARRRGAGFDRTARAARTLSRYASRARGRRWAERGELG